MKHIIGVLAMLLPLLCGAQAPPVKALSVGDTLPDITITNVYNYKDSTIRLQDLKGRLVILDFWSTWCGACIASFPKMEKLQKEFDKQLQIIFVNSFSGDTHTAVANSLKRYQKAGFTLKLPYALLQQQLQNYFPHNAIPHLVWIGKDGVVAAITSSTEATSQNIDEVLAGGKTLHVKKDVIGYDYTKPLFAPGNNNLRDTFLYRSILTPYIEGLGSRSGKVTNGDGMVTMMYDFNKSALGLVMDAYHDNPNIAGGRFILETTNKAVHIQQAWDTNSYCYQLSVPPCTEKEAMKLMQEDVSRMFGIQVKNEQRETPCLLLMAGKNKQSLKTKGGVPSFSLDAANRKKNIINEPLDAICKYFEDVTGTLFINETGCKENVDLHFADSFDVTNKEMLVKALMKAGFVLKEASRRVEYAVISDLP